MPFNRADEALTGGEKNGGNEARNVNSRVLMKKGGDGDGGVKIFAYLRDAGETRGRGESFRGDGEDGKKAGTREGRRGETREAGEPRVR